jgi:hypothetical protein
MITPPDLIVYLGNPPLNTNDALLAVSKGWPPISAEAR